MQVKIQYLQNKPKVSALLKRLVIKNPDTVMIPPYWNYSSTGGVIARGCCLGNIFIVNIKSLNNK